MVKRCLDANNVETTSGHNLTYTVVGMCLELYRAFSLVDVSSFDALHLQHLLTVTQNVSIFKKTERFFIRTLIGDSFELTDGTSIHGIILYFMKKKKKMKMKKKATSF